MAIQPLKAAMCQVSLKIVMIRQPTSVSSRFDQFSSSKTMERLEKVLNN